jgi:hypothetical protein
LISRWGQSARTWIESAVTQVTCVQGDCGSILNPARRNYRELGSGSHGSLHNHSGQTGLYEKPIEPEPAFRIGVIPITGKCELSN